ncbi:MAG: alpha-2-macroglobulin, partial [Aggregatilineales bacterium]
KQGFTISQSVINRAQDYLREQFITPSLSISTYRLNRQAFLLYAMARSGSPDVARNANLFEFRDVLNIDAQVFLAMSLHLSDPDNTDRTDVLLANFVSNATFSATGAHWEEQYRDRWNWSSDTRSTALVLHALTQLTPDSELIPQAVRWLMVARQGRSYWYNTQETAWAVMALTDWMLLSGELQPDYSYRVTWNGDDKLLEAVMPANYDDSETFVIELADMLLTENNELTFDRTDGTGVMYYTARLNVTLPVPEIQALDRGIIIRRQYYAEDDVDMENPITEARVGDNVRVRLSIIAPDALHYVTIEDPLPAGAEAIDPRLPTSRQLGANSVFTRNQYYGWGWWYLKQREFKDEMVRLHASYLPSGTYEFVYSMRPGLPGTYNVMPPYAEENYFPEVFGRGEGMSFTILSADDSDFIDDLTDDALESDSDE